MITFIVSCGARLRRRAPTSLALTVGIYLCELPMCQSYRSACVRLKRPAVLISSLDDFHASKARLHYYYILSSLKAIVVCPNSLLIC